MFTEQPIRVARHRRLPWLTLLLSALAAGLVLCGIGAEGLECDRSAITRAKYGAWRPVISRIGTRITWHGT